MRGEHINCHAVSRCLGGSSPHARGTRPHENRMIRQAGIIPACAGNTTIMSILSSPAKDHPRMRGEHFCIGLIEHDSSGSSPHARGTQGRVRVGCGGKGIIPACAGNTQFLHLFLEVMRDHPRMRGEHADSFVLIERRRGSSPHARGTLAMNL